MRHLQQCAHECKTAPHRGPLGGQRAANARKTACRHFARRAHGGRVKIKFKVVSLFIPVGHRHSRDERHMALVRPGRRRLRLQADHRGDAQAPGRASFHASGSTGAHRGGERQGRQDEHAEEDERDAVSGHRDDPGCGQLVLAKVTGCDVQPRVELVNHSNRRCALVEVLRCLFPAQPSDAAGLVLRQLPDVLLCTHSHTGSLGANTSQRRRDSLAACDATIPRRTQTPGNLRRG